MLPCAAGQLQPSAHASSERSRGGREITCVAVDEGITHSVQCGSTGGGVEMGGAVGDDRLEGVVADELQHAAIDVEEEPVDVTEGAIGLE